MTPIQDLTLRAPDWATVCRTGPAARVFCKNEIGIIGSSAEDVLSHLEGCTEIFLTLHDCLGGDLDVALGIYSGLIGHHVETTIAGKCHSAAVVVALAGCKIRMRETARLMIHGPQMAVFGGVKDMRRAVKRLQVAHAQLLNIFSERTGQSLATVDGWLSGQTYFTAAEALALDLIDEVVSEPKVEKPEAAATSAEPGMLPTGDEAFLWDVLGAMESISVRSKHEFCRDLTKWVACKVRGETTGGG